MLIIQVRKQIPKIINNPTMKSAIIAVLAILTIGSALTDREICQLTLNGVFEQNKLNDPTSLMNCFSDDSVHRIVQFIGERLTAGAKGSAIDTLNMTQYIRVFLGTLPPGELDCAANDTQGLAILPLYNVSLSDVNATEKIIINYILLHYLNVHKAMLDCYNTWFAGQYYDTGFKTANYMHKVLGLTVTLTDRQILQQTLNGVFELNNLSDPTTLMSCASDNTAHQIVVFIGATLNKIVKQSVFDIFFNTTKDIRTFVNTLPLDERKCATQNPEVQPLNTLYHVNTSDINATEKQINSYVITHFINVHKWLIDCDDTWNAGKYYDAGYKSAGYMHQFLGLPNFSKVFWKGAEAVLGKKIGDIGKIFAQANQLRSVTEEFIDAIIT